MTDVVIVRQGDGRPDVTATLKRGDVPVPLDSALAVKFRLVDALTGASVLMTDAVMGASVGAVAHNWQPGQTDVPGTYTASWLVQWAAQEWETFPSLGGTQVAVVGLTLLPGTSVTWTEVEAALGRPLTPVEVAGMPLLLDGLLGALEVWTNRPLRPTRVTGEQQWVPQWGQVLPYKGPVTQMHSMTYFEELSPQPLMYTGESVAGESWRNVRFTPGRTVLLDYTAGTDLTGDPAVAQVLRDALVGSLLAGTAVSSGAVSSYSVEGTSITWNVGSGSEVARISEAGTKSLGRLRRPVWR